MPPFATDADREAVHRREFADHTILMPPNRLKQRAARYVDLNGHEDADPVRRAENALKLLSNEFDNWMEMEIGALEAARATAVGANDIAELSTLYRVSHDIRGQAATLGFPLAGQLADGLCKLIERADKAVPSAKLIDLHVDAIRAMVRENVRDRENPIGAALVHRLKELRGEEPA
ncbi:Hpt domain-containing protein [Chelatococcus sambhunathii]|uniref:Hpt domain-containing protein n=1 Tax=Chelatococcus sambhunathii TaxID=363953 RepID=A0ABU1DC95_9HYPH|nr:Hpt domain-containing protein [Chelatococcus sambhunathii]MDR4305540.1 Hpt domain-containing protein [Chelatococcus sambhunathii]